MKFSPEVVAALAVLREHAENDFERHRIDVLERDLTAPPTVEIVDDDHQRFNGVIYRKDRSGHYVSTSRALHRDVWHYANGEIPKGYVVHHADFNKANNSLSNLQCLTDSAHKAIHGFAQKANTKQNRRCKNCKRAFAAFRNKKFCCDKCRRDYYHGKEKKFSRRCQCCGKKFKTRTAKSRFCSLKCANDYKRS